jgi:glycosyltransferase involved in cell wall biosynthesis
VDIDPSRRDAQLRELTTASRDAFVTPPNKATQAVVITCHNYATYLTDAVESVVSQSQPADQIVIVDDGSTDESGAVAERLAAAHPCVTILSHERPRGPNAARNAGASVSASDLLCFLDADDRLSPNYLEALGNALAGQTKTFAYGSTLLFGDRAHFVAARCFSASQLRRGNRFALSAVFPRQLFDDLGGLDTEMDAVGLEDWDFWLRATRAGYSGRPVADAWLEYRQHRTSRNRLPLRALVRAYVRVWHAHAGYLTRRDLLVGIGEAVAWRLWERVRPFVRFRVPTG